MGSDVGLGWGALRGVLSVFFAGILIVCVAGLVFGVHVMFYGPETRISQFAFEATVLRQKLYNESNARLLKDISVGQQIDAATLDLIAESATRESEYETLLVNITTETDVRIANEQVLFYGVANETDARIAADIIIDEGIANVTAMVLSAEAYDIFSDSKFADLMANITYMDNLLMAEINERIASRQAFANAGAASDNMIAYLIAALAAEIHEREVYDVLIDQAIAYLAAGAASVVTSINFRNGTNGNMDILSANANALSIITVPGKLTLTSHVVCTINGVFPDPSTKNIFFTAGAGMVITTSGGPPNWTVGASGTFLPPNYATLSGAGVLGLTTYPTLTPGDANFEWLPVGCVFQPFNGGTCGWTAPDTGTYIVHISATFTLSLLGAQHNSIHFSMGTGKGVQLDTLASPFAFPEISGLTNGAIFPLDSVHVGSYAVTTSQYFDVHLSGTVVVASGSGMDVGGCSGSVWASCGYGLPVYFKVTNGRLLNNNQVLVQAAYVLYTWTRAT